MTNYNIFCLKTLSKIEEDTNLLNFKCQENSINLNAKTIKELQDQIQPEIKRFGELFNTLIKDSKEEFDFLIIEEESISKLESNIQIPDILENVLLDPRIKLNKRTYTSEMLNDKAKIEFFSAKIWFNFCLYKKS